MKKTLLALVAAVLAALPVAAQQKTPLQIVQEARESAPADMTHDDVAKLMRRIAGDLNGGGIPGGPFGILVKTTGNNCGGYSCDVICAGNGAAQRQWDVLIDENKAAWNPVDPAGQAVRPCEIVPASTAPVPTPTPTPTPTIPPPTIDLSPLYGKLAEIDVKQDTLRDAINKVDANLVALAATVERHHDEQKAHVDGLIEKHWPKMVSVAVGVIGTWLLNRNREPEAAK